MNVLHVISVAASGGAEVYIKDLAKYLSEQGHKIHIAFLSTAVDASRDLGYEKKFLDDLKCSNIPIYVIGNETRKKPWLGIARLRKYVVENNIDICHTHLAYGIIFSALLKIPVVYTHHTIQPRWGKSTYTVFNRLVDEYVGISEKCAAALEGYTGRKVTTITNAVSEEKFSGYIRKRVLRDAVNIAMIGRITVQKDYMNMLQALILLDKNILKKIKVRVAGEGNSQYKNDLLDFVSNNKLNHFVDLVGVQTNIPEFLYQSDIFLMSSAWEGLPIALTEAAMSGLPCIVTDVGGCSEIISKSQNGVVIPPNRPQELANEITRFVTDPEVIEHYSTNAINNAHKYSISIAGHSHLDLYSRLLNK